MAQIENERDYARMQSLMDELLEEVGDDVARRFGVSPVVFL